MKKIFFQLLLILLFSAIIKSQSLESRLLEACYKNEEREVFDLLRMGASANAKTQDGISAIMYTVQNGNYILTQKLLESGANPNYSTQMNPAPILNASLNNDTAITILLLEYGAQPDFADYWTNKTPLIIAIEKENLILIDYLLYYGANVNKQGNENPLIYALYNGADTSVIKILLKYKPNINICDENQMTPLVYSIENGNIEYVKILLEAGCNVYQKCKNSTNTPLAYSIKGNKKEITYILLPYYKDSLEIYHKIAISKDYAWAAKRIRKITDKKYLLPSFSTFCIGTGFLTTYNDVMFNFLMSIHESLYNFDIGIGLQTRLGRSRVLIPYGNRTFLQLWEHRTIAKAFVVKYFPLFYTEKGVNGLFTEAIFNNSYGKYDGTQMDIQKKQVFSGAIGYWHRWEFFRFRLGYEFLPVQTNFPHFFKIDLWVLINLKRY